ncbi:MULTISPECIES: 4Fe-4S dicluster domain-containing protein [Thermodesulfovibrio]|uniref:4Fe-4S dicluster domain-containing protein n=1 Tax=Thermodesulfovibrio TaxID=28261 RepID=UPI002625B498|nr:4Fe-4S dicluster domain-containing protein [Thermodesulfovibrio sp.]
MKISRRGFLAMSTALCGNFLLGNKAEAAEGKYATIIDITKCDGCKDEPIPLCVKACRDYNKDRFPEPKKPILPYWPRKTYEDWSDKRDKIDTLTPYNWIFVQKLTLEGEKIYIPRRCMHCDNPPCVRECPFGALTKQPEGNSVISDKICFGGAKCRDVCPWHIPQRQAGVGIYLELLPKYAGGGVMYKCDLCKDKIKKGEEPACVVACRERLGDKSVFVFDERKKIFETAMKRAKEERLYIYGDKQNGGTSTLYLSKVPFDKIEQTLKEKKERFQMPIKVENKIESKFNPIGKIVLASAVVSMAGGILGALSSRKTKKEEEGNEKEN